MHALVVACAAAVALAGAPAPPLFAGTRAVHAFYYLWYATPSIDGNWSHWDHSILPHWTPAVAAQYPPPSIRFLPPQDIHAPFYPARGPYSSRDPAALVGHFKELAAAGVGVAVASWWGREGVSAGDSQGVLTDAALAAALDAAAAAGGATTVALHLEPYAGRTAASVRADVAHLIARFGSHSALARAADGRPIVYVYDSYHIASDDWAAVLASGGADSVRGTANDAVFFGLWLERGGAADLARGGFDGAYTYFSSPIASWAADSAHWPDMAREAASLGLLFSPSVSPGYDDSKIRPWNAATRVDRLAGATYRAAWAAARATRPDVVSITSWNEWGEGSQIEPAVPRSIDVDTLAPLGAALPRATRDALRLRVPDGYDDYGAGGPNLYLDITRDEAAAFAAAPHERAPPPRYEAEL